MPRDLFGNVTRPSVAIGNRKWYTVPVSLLSHIGIVGAVVVIPLMATDVLPPPWQKLTPVYITIAPPPPPPPRLRPPDAPPLVDRLLAPTIAPEGIEPERPAPDPSFQDDVPVGTIVGVGDVSAAMVVPDLPPPPARQQPVPIGGAIQAPQRLHNVLPVYPPIAQAARVQGIVIIEATIGEDGRVVNARILRSVPLLDQAALEAVRQWQYTPTLLNGVPVPVVMSVTVQFVLSR